MRCGYKSTKKATVSARVGSNQKNRQLVAEHCSLSVRYLASTLPLPSDTSYDTAY